MNFFIVKFIQKIFFITFLFVTSIAFADGILSKPQGFITDNASVISSADQNTITQLITELKNKTTAEIAVVTVKTVTPETIQSFSMKIFDQWKIGEAKKDNGVLLVVAIEDHQAHITTGYGVEGFLTDALCNRIVMEVMAPSFKAGQYSKGILDGVDAIVSLVAKEYQIEITGHEKDVLKAKSPRDDARIFIIVLVIIVILIRISQRSGSRFGGGIGSGGFGGGGFGGGGFGGGSFGGFGGGSSGGGGGGGNW